MNTSHMVIIFMISPFVLPFLHSVILQIFMEFGKEYGNAYEEYDNAYEDVGDGYKGYDDDYNGSVYDSGDVSEDGEQGTSSDIMQDESLENMSVEDDSNIHVTTPTGDRIVFTLNEDGTYSSQAQTENGTELAHQRTDMRPRRELCQRRIFGLAPSGTKNRNWECVRNRLRKKRARRLNRNVWRRNMKTDSAWRKFAT